MKHCSMKCRHYCGIGLFLFVVIPFVMLGCPCNNSTAKRQKVGQASEARSAVELVRCEEQEASRWSGRIVPPREYVTAFVDRIMHFPREDVIEAIELAMSSKVEALRYYVIAVLDQMIERKGILHTIRQEIVSKIPGDQELFVRCLTHLLNDEKAYIRSEASFYLYLVEPSVECIGVLFGCTDEERDPSPLVPRQPKPKSVGYICRKLLRQFLGSAVRQSIADLKTAEDIDDVDLYVEWWRRNSGKVCVESQTSKLSLELGDDVGGSEDDK